MTMRTFTSRASQDYDAESSGVAGLASEKQKWSSATQHPLGTPPLSCAADRPRARSVRGM